MDMKKLRSAVGIAVAAAALLSTACGGNKPKLKDENNPVYQYQKGAIALKYGLSDEALRYGNLAVGLDPNYYDGWMLLGSAYYDRRDFKSSADAYGKAAALKPGSFEAHKSLGMVCAESGEAAMAEAEFRKALAINREADTCFRLGRLLLSQKRAEEALEFAESAVRAPDVKPAYYNLKGALLNQLGRYDEALGSFMGGLVLDPNDVGLLINLGIAYLNREDNGKARETFEKVLPMIKDLALRNQIQQYLEQLKELK